MAAKSIMFDISGIKRTKKNSQECDDGMLGAGIAFLIMGLFLLAGVVYTLIKIYKPNDENVKTDKNHSQEGIIK